MPAAFIVTVPLAAPPFTPTSVHTLPPSPLGVSLPVTLPLTGVSSVVLFTSFTATGISSTAVMVIVTVAVEQSPSTSHT